MSLPARTSILEHIVEIKRLKTKKIFVGYTCHIFLYFFYQALGKKYLMLAQANKQ